MNRNKYVAAAHVPAAPAHKEDEWSCYKKSCRNAGATQDDADRCPPDDADNDGAATPEVVLAQPKTAIMFNDSDVMFWRSPKRDEETSQNDR